MIQLFHKETGYTNVLQMNNLQQSKKTEMSKNLLNKFFRFKQTDQTFFI